MSAPPPAYPPAAGRASWYVGVLALVVMAYILVNTLRTQGPGSQGPRPGSRLPPFAAPAVLSDLSGDANVATADTAGGPAGAVPACRLRGPRIVSSCRLARGRPLVLGFFFTRGSRCTGSFDAMQRLRARYPRVRFAGVVVRGSRDEARRIVRERGWTFPIAYDRDGAIANLYGVAGCPEVVLARAGGVVAQTLVGRDRAERGLGRRVAALAAGP